MAGHPPRHNHAGRPHAPSYRHRAIRTPRHTGGGRYPLCFSPPFHVIPWLDHGTQVYAFFLASALNTKTTNVKTCHPVAGPGTQVYTFAYFVIAGRTVAIRSFIPHSNKNTSSSGGQKNRHLAVLMDIVPVALAHFAHRYLPKPLFRVSAHLGMYN